MIIGLRQKRAEGSGKRTKLSASGAPRGTVVIPNLITLGNAVCGFAALTLIATAQVGTEVDLDGSLRNLHRAAWFVLLGMVFDVLDGRVARLTGGTSSFGAQLDSLADLVTFGIAPAGLLVVLNHAVTSWPPWSKIAWIFGLAYFLGAMLRLARFNVEHDEAEDAHLCFKGLPTPAAAGTVAGLTLVYFWLLDWKSWELRAFAETAPVWAIRVGDWIPLVLPFVGFVIGYAMVSSRLIYPHVASQLIGRRHSFDFFAFLIFAGILVAFVMEASICAAFLLYTLWPFFSRWLPGQGKSGLPGVPEGPEVAEEQP